MVEQEEWMANFKGLTYDLRGGRLREREGGREGGRAGTEGGGCVRGREGRREGRRGGKEEAVLE